MLPRSKLLPLPPPNGARKDVPPGSARGRSSSARSAESVTPHPQATSPGDLWDGAGPLGRARRAALAGLWEVGLLGDATSPLVTPILRVIHRTGRQANKIWRPIYRFLLALARLWKVHTPTFQ